MIRFYILEWLYQAYPWTKAMLPYVTIGWFAMYVTVICVIFCKKGFS